jgi:outer membrane protein OmpA-like peptidoglycan-associated protein
VSMAKRMVMAAGLLLLVSGSLFADVFRFAYTKGEKYRLLSQVHEAVLLNGRFSHDADILNKIAVTVTDTRGDAGYNVVAYQTSERSTGATTTYAWSEAYASEFWQDGRGGDMVDPAYFMPVVRNVPYFPDGDIAPGDTWSAPGTESHDFRTSFGIPEPVQFPIDVSYRYLRNETRNGVACAVFSVDYEVLRSIKVSAPPTARLVPTRVAAESHQTLWWDIANRRPVYDEESFDFTFWLSSGDQVEFKGTSTGELIEAEPLDRNQVAADIRKQLDDQKVPGVTVAPTDNGVTITLDNVNFPPNSDQLLPAEQDKLRRIAEILRKYPDRDIAVAGFTARAPGYTEDDYQSLSELRANAAANFLLSTGAVTAKHLSARGMGASNPIGDNTNEAERAKNRRVEITILEN